jgi:COP9 signalosome complex subunit 2
MLDYIEKTAEDEAANSCIEKFYSLTLESFQSTNNERLWLKTNIKLARLWFAQKNYRQLTDLLRDLHKACQKEDGTDDPSKGTLSLEVYALEIQMYAETRNNKRLKVRNIPGEIRHKNYLTSRQALYQRALRVKSAVPHPKIMGIIRECGGKMHMSEGGFPTFHLPLPQYTNVEQRIGKRHRVTSSRAFATTTRRVRSSGSRFSSI